MELFDAIYGRRSIRRFIEKDIEPEKLKEIISAANFAPSACNIQGARYIVINTVEVKNKLIDAGTISFIKDAPIGILVLYDNRTEGIEYEDHIQSAAAAIQNMLLAAHSLGIGSCWICHLPLKKTLRKLLNIPKSYDPIAYIALGYYDKNPEASPRKYGFNELVSSNAFELKTKTPNKTILSRFLKRQAFKIYKRLPFKKYLLPITKRFERFN